MSIRGFKNFSAPSAVSQLLAAEGVARAFAIQELRQRAAEFLLRRRHDELHAFCSQRRMLGLDVTGVEPQFAGARRFLRRGAMQRQRGFAGFELAPLPVIPKRSFSPSVSR